MDKRWKELVGTEITSETRVVLAGFPVDEGVSRNGGRIGAAQGPSRIREQLSKFTPDARNATRHEAVLRRTVDVGDLPLAGSLEENQAQLGTFTAEQLKAGRIPVILGGGHETTFGHFLGYATLNRDVSLRNCDAHADVRELKDGKGHSGSPFRQMLEHFSGVAKGYAVAGLEPHAVSEAHAAFVNAHGQAVWRDQLSAIQATERNLFWTSFFSAAEPVLASFDIDAVSGASAPGVSALNPAGLPPEIWLEGAYAAGKSESVTSMDVVEFNPLYDRDNLTARLAALTIWTFTAGVAARNVG